jgi:tRNA (guanine-N7-)-methyltransferase
VQLFFPDPWHKRRHHKRRIVNAEFIQLIYQKLKSGGLFHLATDWQDYAEHMLQVMEQADAFTNTAGKGNYAVNTGRPLTKFEHRGQHLGHGVWDLVYRKN